MLGILGVMCQVLARIAWVIGSREMAAIDAGLRPPENRSTANAGRILGIIGAVLIGVGFVIIFLILMSIIAL